MSATILYRLQGVRVYKHKKIISEKGEVKIYFSIPKNKCVCPSCGNQFVWFKEWRQREFKGVPSGLTPVTLVVDVPKIYCPVCHASRQVHLPFARSNKHYTRAFEHYVLSLLEGMTVKKVAEFLGVSWDTIRDIEQHYLERHFAHPSLKGLQYIAIDEISSKKGFHFLTLVMNLENGQIIYVGNGRQEDALTDFWKKLRRARCKILAVASDMSRSYTKAIREHLPDVVHVFDRFHIVKMFNEVINNVRRSLYRKIKDKDEKQALKGLKYILLKRPEHLDPSKGEPERLQKNAGSQ